ncbi:MAG: SLC13 family permease, partial [Fimbriimonadales bacterium]
MERILSQLRTAALVLGPLFAVAPLFIPPPAELPVPAWRLVGLTAWMALWWFSECVPIPATALVPLVWMPLVGIADEKQVASRYADPIIFLFLGGFLIALGMQRWGLHRRIAFAIVSRSGNTPAQVVGGFMLATAFLSMWVNNTSTTMMMFAVALSVVEWVRSSTQGSEDTHKFGVALMLGIAYSASIGGVGTLIGTAPNALLAGFLRENYNYALNMANWLFVGLPFVGLMLPFCWFWLTRIQFYAKGLNFDTIKERLAQERAQMPPMCAAERWVLGIFLFA